MKTYRVEVYGRVQGVNFRNSVKRYADAHGIFGNVKNQSDGSVLLIVQGDPVRLRDMLSWVESSPGFCKVERAEVEEVKTAERFRDFEIVFEGSFLKDKGKAVRNLGKRFVGKN